MGYCSLEEAWGNEFAELYKNYDSSLLPRMPEREENGYLDEREITQVSKPVEKQFSSDEISKYYMEKKTEIEHNNLTPNCENFLDHYFNCKKCQERIEYIGKKDVVEKFENKDER